jgi:pyruvate ferredoxin oxidoreductase beta subunit
MNRKESLTYLHKGDYFKSGHPLCPGCGGGIFWRLITKVMGKNSIVSVAASCICGPAGFFPSALDLPTCSGAFATAAPQITGISAAIRVLKRKAKLSKDSDFNVFAVAGDGGTADIGFAGLSGAAERNDDGVYFCVDNEAYMMTGIQRSSQTPGRTWTTFTPEGKPQKKKDVPMIMAAHKVPYVATTCIAFPDDLISKAVKAKEMKGGFRYIHTLCSCPTGWRIPEKSAIEIARLAVECGMWLLYEIEQGEFKITYKPKKRKQVREYLSRQGRFDHLNANEVEIIQSEVDAQCAEYDF